LTISLGVRVASFVIAQVAPFGGRHLALWLLRRWSRTDGFDGRQFMGSLSIRHSRTSHRLLEDIGSRSNYPLTLMRRTTLTDEVMVDNLTPRGAKTNLPITRHHDLSGSTRMLGKNGDRSPWPRWRMRPSLDQLHPVSRVIDPKPATEPHKPTGVIDPSGRGQLGKQLRILNVPSW
jgi:hypothetical protein